MACPEPSIRVSPDGMQAIAQIPDDVDESLVTLEAFEAQATEVGVRVTDEVRARIKAFVGAWASAPGEIESIIAEGTLPVHGEDAGVDLLPEVTNVPPTDDDPDADKIDFYEGGSYASVEEGQLIGHIRAESVGKDGTNVRGEAIVARSGRAVTIDIDESVVRKGNDLHAARGGMVVATPERVAISDVLPIEDCVDFSTGNVHFNGSVRIRNGVNDRFVVEASGDVTVGGVIEGATMIVGGSLYCGCGMAAKERGQILIDGDCVVGYMNCVRGRIRGSLKVRRELMDCELVIGGDLGSSGASIVGGHLAVTGSVEVATLGSEGGAPTLLTLGEVPVIARRLQQLEAIQQEFVTQKDAAMASYETLLESNPNPPEAERLALMQEMDDCTVHLDAVELKRQELVGALRASRRVDVLIHREIHERVTMRIGGETYEFSERLGGPIEISSDRNGQPMIRLADGRLRPLLATARRAA